MSEYKQYLLDLARELCCNIYLGPNVAGMMYVEFGYVEGPDPGNSSSYTPQQAFAVGLHELGHFYHGHTQGRPPREDLTAYFDRGVLRSEAEAWDYTFDHFDERGEDLSPSTLTWMWESCIGTYYRASLREAGRNDCQLWNGDRHHVRFTWDEPDELFWQVQRRMVSSEEALAA